jgi:hypothetical protein
MSNIDVQLAATGSAENISNTKKYISVNNVNVYEFMDHAYHGTGGFRDGTFLVPHSREMFYDSRRDLAFYKNFVKPIIRAMIEPVFSKEAARTVEPTNNKFQEFIADCDNAGTSLQSFMEDALITARLHGVVFIVVENFPMEEQPETEEAVVEARLFPYIYQRTARQVEKYQLDKFGGLLSITFREADVIVVKNGAEVVESRYLKWTSTYSEEYTLNEKNEITVITKNEHNLGVLPVIPIFTMRRKDKNSLLIDPPLYDLAKLNLTIFNKDSEIREIERSQGFSLLYVQSDTQGNLTIGSNNVLFVPMAATIPPGFASPNPAIQTNLMLNATSVREDLFRLAEQNGVIGVQQAKSGLALSWEFFAHE